MTKDQHEDLEQHLGRYGEVLGDAGRCGVWGVVGVDGEMRGGTGRCGEMWGGTGRCGEMGILQQHLVEVACVVD